MIEVWGGEQRAIPILLANAWLLTQPTCPELDEPVAEQKARAERARRIAVMALWLIYRDQLARSDVDDGVRRFFMEQMELRVGLATDRVVMPDDLLGRPKRGAPRRTAARHFDLAADIQKLMIDQEIPADEACRALSERLDQGLAADTLHDIYYRETRNRVDKRAIAAELVARDVHELEELRRKAEAEGLNTADEKRFAHLEAKIAEWFRALSLGAV